MPEPVSSANGVEIGQTKGCCRASGAADFGCSGMLMISGFPMGLAYVRHSVFAPIVYVWPIQHMLCRTTAGAARGGCRAAAGGSCGAAAGGRALRALRRARAAAARELRQHRLQPPVPGVHSLQGAAVVTGCCQSLPPCKAPPLEYASSRLGVEVMVMQQSTRPGHCTGRLVLLQNISSGCQVQEGSALATSGVLRYGAAHSSTAR